MGFIPFYQATFSGLTAIRETGILHSDGAGGLYSPFHCSAISRRFPSRAPAAPYFLPAGVHFWDAWNQARCAPAETSCLDSSYLMKHQAGARTFGSDHITGRLPVIRAIVNACFPYLVLVTSTLLWRISFISLAAHIATLDVGGLRLRMALRLNFDAFAEGWRFTVDWLTDTGTIQRTWGRPARRGSDFAASGHPGLVDFRDTVSSLHDTGGIDTIVSGATRHRAATAGGLLPSDSAGLSPLVAGQWVSVAEHTFH